MTRDSLLARAIGLPGLDGGEGGDQAHRAHDGRDHLVHLGMGGDPDQSFYPVNDFGRRQGEGLSAGPSDSSLFRTETIFGRNRRICSLRSRILRPAERLTTSKRSGN